MLVLVQCLHINEMHARLHHQPVTLLPVDVKKNLTFFG